MALGRNTEVSGAVSHYVSKGYKQAPLRDAFFLGFFVDSSVLFGLFC
jgi:hypothetical protein